MTLRRSKNERRVVLEMHEQHNSYHKISVVLGILQSTCCDIVQKFGNRRSLKDKTSPSRLRILDEHCDGEIVRRLND